VGLNFRKRFLEREGILPREAGNGGLVQTATIKSGFKLLQNWLELGDSWMIEIDTADLQGSTCRLQSIGTEGEKLSQVIPPLEPHKLNNRNHRHENQRHHPAVLTVVERRLSETLAKERNNQLWKKQY